MKKKIIEDAVTICDKVADAVNQRNNGRPHCRTYCPGEEALIEILNRLALEIKDIEPECFIRLNQELLSLKTPNCVNPFSLGPL
ncbi:hypothetical protein [uncultured Rikenella sp.]|uniref:hypothetical protein n=1 Tax=uncultured Rikenella sp. TaxID=368003 RepID=UPI00261716FC|nr:hypothetical protein [uncultured Rikenella sp.]